MNPKDLGLKIKNYRITKNYTQQEFADLLFIAPQTVSKWERGLSYPDVFRLKEVCNILGVSLNDILGDNDNDDNNESEYMIAIDGGGTKAEFALFRSDGTVIATETLGACNPNTVGIESSMEVLTTGINSLLSYGKIPKRIFGGIAGTRLAANKRVIFNALKKTYPAFNVTVDSDIMNIIGLVADNKKCISAIVGTGSVVYGKSGDNLRRVGGWGYLLDDAGSGYDIGREVLLACYSYADGLTPISHVVRLAEIKLGGSISEKLTDIYKSDRSYIASFCPIAFEAMAAGDKVAEEIITRSFGRFARLINHLYHTGEYGNRVAISGGIAIHCESIKNVIAPLLDPGITLEFPTEPPIFGAMRYCAELELGQLNFEQFKKNFTDSYKF